MPDNPIVTPDTSGEIPAPSPTAAMQGSSVVGLADTANTAGTISGPGGSGTIG